jgi:hypothetical protein
MNRRRIAQLMSAGEVLPSDQVTDLRQPAVPSTILKSSTVTANFVEPKYVVGPISKIVMTLDGLEMTVRDTEQGGYVKLLDFPLGTFRVRSVSASLQFTTTSVLADTLNASKTMYWGIGTSAQATTGLTGVEADLLSGVSATSSATIDTANTATTGKSVVERVLNGGTTAADVYLNLVVPTAGDIDADATVEIDGTITIEYEDLGTGAIATPVTVSRMPSAELWRNCPWDAIAKGEVDGFVYFNDFTSGGYALAANQTVTKLNDGVSGETGATAGSVITQAADAPYGVVKLESTTDNEGAIIMALGGTNDAGQVVMESGKRLWFEARVKRSVITDSKINVFVGFAEEALCADGSLITTSDAMADKDYVGFQGVFADGDKFDTVYNTASGGSSPVTVGTDAVTVGADTWLKLGIYCNGTTVYFFADGVQLTDSIALTGTDFPDGEEMAFYFGLMLGHADTNSISIDWVKVAQQRA